MTVGPIVNGNTDIAMCFLLRYFDMMSATHRVRNDKMLLKIDSENAILIHGYVFVIVL